MKLDVELHEGVLARDWTSARGRTGERTSARLRLFGPSGMVGVGEATPLPGYSPEELSTAVDELGAVPLQELLPVLDSDDPVAAAFRNPALVALSASARCGLEMALLDMISQQRGILFSELFDTESTDTLETAAVITLGDSSLEQARACLERGAAAAS